MIEYLFYPHIIAMIAIINCHIYNTSLNHRDLDTGVQISVLKYTIHKKRKKKSKIKEKIQKNFFDCFTVFFATGKPARRPDSGIRSFTGPDGTDTLFPNLQKDRASRI